MKKSLKKITKVPPEIEKIGRVSNASVLKCTGKSWSFWISALERSGAQSWAHQELTSHLKSKFKLSSWWQQGVAMGFEIYTGKRIEGRTLKGDYSVTVTKSLHHSPQKIWNFLSSRKGLATWIDPLSDFSLTIKSQFEIAGGIYGEVRTIKAPVRIRLSWINEDWPKPTTVQVHVVPKPKSSCILVFSHTGLQSSRQREEMRAHWISAVQRIYELVAEL